MSRVVVRSGRGRLHVASEVVGVGYLGVCGSLVLRPSAIEALDARQAEALQAAAPGAVCHYCRLIGAEVTAAVERAVEVALLEQAVDR